ncbi:MAG: porin [Xanthobacteraceae bacterium]|nr:porin [Xanthobacteraceae bacterium]
MKMVKSLLLGSAAGVVAVAGAQAADLPVKAKPVQYVKICTLYGDGFYYIPGSDTCIRFSGYVRADYNWNGRAPHVQTGANGAQDRTVQRSSTRHRANLAVDTRTQTAYGTLRTFINFNIDNELGGDSVQASRAFIQWGGFTFGRTASFTDHEGSLGDSGFRSLYTGLVDATTGAAGINQIAYTWQLGNGITLNVGADDSRSRNIANLGVTAVTVGTDPTNSQHGQSHPDPWVSLRVSQAWGRASVAVIGHKNAATYYTQNPAAPCAQTGTTLCGYPDDKWGFAVVSGIEIKLDALSPGSRIGGYVTYGQGASRITRNSQTSPGLFGSGNEIAFGVLTDAAYLNGSNLEQTTSWAVGGGFEYFWTRNFSSTIYGGYTRTEYNNNVINGRWFCGGAGGNSTQTAITVAAGVACDPGYSLWQVGTHHDWFPVPGLRFAVDVLYTGVESAFAGNTVTLGKATGARPTGAYAAKDLGILSVAFRAQRSWGAGD